VTPATPLKKLGHVILWPALCSYSTCVHACDNAKTTCDK